jgi:hypothetical protein
MTAELSGMRDLELLKKSYKLRAISVFLFPLWFWPLFWVVISPVLAISLFGWNAMAFYTLNQFGVLCGGTVILSMVPALLSSACAAYLTFRNGSFGYFTAGVIGFCNTMLCLIIISIGGRGSLEEPISSAMVGTGFALIGRFFMIPLSVLPAKSLKHSN